MLRSAIACVSALLLTACGKAAPPSPGTSKPPYEALDTGRLRIREDLVSQFNFARARASDVQATLQGFGRVAFAPNASYAVRVPFPAFVERVHVAVGSELQAGQALATLRSSEVARLRSELGRLSIAISAEKDAVERLEKLVNQGAASSRDLVEARARYSTAKAELQGTRLSLSAAGVSAGSGDTFELKATAEGQLLARSVDPGERVTPEDGDAAFLIGDGKKLVVRAAFPERDAPLLAEGAPCAFTVPALGAQRIEGKVMHAVRAVDRRTHTTEAACSPTTDEPRLRAEMSARVEVTVRGAERLLVVPRGAVLLRRDDRVVLVQVEPGVLERRVVEVGSNLGDDVQILKGLNEGDDVVTTNAVLLDGELDLIL